MAKLIRIHGAALLAALLFVPAARAQQTDSTKTDPREQPVAPDRAFLAATNAGDSTLDVLQEPTTDVQEGATELPLSGVQEQTLTQNITPPNYLLPSVSVMSLMGINTGGGSVGLSTFDYLLGSVDLNHTSDRSELLVHYSGGGMFSSYLNSAVQNLDFTYNYKWQRWSLLAGDQAGYLSESPFGFGGIAGLEFLTGNSQISLGQLLGPFASLTPNQTIPTIIVPQLTNTVVSQIAYEVSPRSSWTASGSFATLNFFGAGYINDQQGQFQTGYNYAISPASSVAAIYRFDDFQFTYLPVGIEDHIAELGYGRYVTGRLSFQVAAGPSFEMLRGVVTSAPNHLSWALNGLLNYQMDRTTLLLTYSHLITGGSGVLVGAQTSQIQASLNRKLSPKWQLSASLGYAINQSLVPISLQAGNGSFNSWYALVQLNHPLRPGSSVFFGYGAQLQAFSTGVCGIPNCATNGVAHQISAGFNFDFRPISLR